MESNITTIPPEHINRYHPYNEAEFNELQLILQSITTHIPNDKMGWIWSNYLKVTKTTEPQPCSCGSAAGHWRRAVEGLRDFVTKVQNVNE
jgi:hypothetical protein